MKTTVSMQQAAFALLIASTLALAAFGDVAIYMATR